MPNWKSEFCTFAGSSPSTHPNLGGTGTCGSHRDLTGIFRFPGAVKVTDEARRPRDGGGVPRGFVPRERRPSSRTETGSWRSGCFTTGAAV